MRAPDLPHLIVLIPAYNEEAHLGSVLARARRYLPVLVVDDGSSDRTPEIARSGGAVLVRQEPNQGKGQALRTGFRYALEHGYAGTLTLDADGQHDADEIPIFLDAFNRTKADLIIGERDFSHIPPVRRLANTLGRESLSWALGQPVPDNQSGYRLVSSRLAEALLSSREQGFEFEVEMIVTCIERGYSLAWVPIRTIYADEKSHIRPVQHVINYFRIVWQTRQRRRKLAYVRRPQT